MAARFRINWFGGTEVGGTLLIENQQATATLPTQIHGLHCLNVTCISLEKTSHILEYDIDIPW